MPLAGMRRAVGIPSRGEAAPRGELQQEAAIRHRSAGQGEKPRPPKPGDPEEKEDDAGIGNDIKTMWALAVASAKEDTRFGMIKVDHQC